MNETTRALMPADPIVLVANNPFGHHLLTAQLLDIYKGLKLDREIILLCNGMMPNVDASIAPHIKPISFAKTRFGAINYLILMLTLVQFRWRHPKSVYHLRGFVAGTFFSLSRFFLIGAERYVYDPRGAFFIEWREAGRSILISRVFAIIESRLIRHSTATIVTSERFAKLYRKLFGYPTRYRVIYNSTSFPFQGSDKSLPSEGRVRIVYLGTFNHWHDMGEVARVISSIVEQIGPQRSEVYIYTSNKFHAAAAATFGPITCAALRVGYVIYHDLPSALSDKHIGVSVVRPTVSTRIASPIKISDYVAFGLIPVLNSGIGDFDEFFKTENSALLYKYGEVVDATGLDSVRTSPNGQIYDCVSKEEAKNRLAKILELLING